ncbi:MAG: HAMP domain-containing histidine kinase [Anaerolineales bacterium]|nr:HAMP domain-containing histidine kinase [Chloroflexota bacterium]MBL6981839.1 HAMP domain-containing histidine kinase [Anaerolineales bacterium]
MVSIGKLFDVSTADMEDQRRGRLLSIVLFGLFLITILLIPFIFIIGKNFLGGWQSFTNTLWSSIVFFLGLIILFWLNRNGKILIASITFTILLIFAITIANIEAMGRGDTLFYFVIPILLSSVLIRPYASFFTAAIITLESIFIAIQLNFVPDYYFTAFGLFAIAFVSWLTSRNLENALSDLRIINLELDQRVEQRTNELASAYTKLEKQTHELSAANIQLQELDTLKSKFVSDVSHELRTPISNISIYLEMIQAGKPDKRERYLAVLSEETSRLQKLITDILDLSRLEKEVTATNYVWSDLNELVEKMVIANRLGAEAKGLEFTFVPGENLPKILVDVDLVNQALINLIANAINYTPEGNVKLETHFDAEESRLVFEIADTGIGIEPNDIQYIFKRFYRGTQTGQSTIPGTGLGLAITEEIVEKHGGGIDVQSEVGVGSKFTVHFPVARTKLETQKT